MTPDERITKLEKELDRVKNENRRLIGTYASRTDFHPMTDKEYVMNLQRGMLRLEALYDKLNEDFQELYAFSRHQTELLDSFDVITPQQEF